MSDSPFRQKDSVSEPVSHSECESVPPEPGMSGKIDRRTPVKRNVDGRAGDYELRAYLACNGELEACPGIALAVNPVGEAERDTRTGVEIEVAGTAEMEVIESRRTEALAHEAEISLHEIRASEIMLI